MIDIDWANSANEKSQLCEEIHASVILTTTLYTSFFFLSPSKSVSLIHSTHI